VSAISLFCQPIFVLCLSNKLGLYTIIFVTIAVFLLRQLAYLHCDFFWHFNVFVSDILLRASNFLCVKHFIMCQPFYILVVILCYLSHLQVVCQSFSCV
jgi:hypothetical protein